jgi:hypothetical protein
MDSSSPFQERYSQAFRDDTGGSFTAITEPGIPLSGSVFSRPIAGRAQVWLTLRTAAGRPPGAEVPDDLPPVDIDPTLISRVLANLLENAIRHGPRHSTITIGGVLASPQAVMVYVADHGLGVSPERRDEVFQSFARRRGDSGAGLGLTIAKTFVEAHGQRIWAEDAPGGGARFCFTLPVGRPARDEPRGDRCRGRGAEGCREFSSLMTIQACSASAASGCRPSATLSAPRRQARRESARPPSGRRT